MASQTLGTCAEHKLSVIDEHEERANRVERAQWLRAAILGANDGLLSTTSLMLGMGAASEDRWSMILSGIAGAVAGACSMAVGEYVSVSTQRDIEKMVNIRTYETRLCGQEDVVKRNSTSSPIIASPVTVIETRLSNTCIAMSPTVTPGGRIQGGELEHELPPEIVSLAMTPRRRLQVLSPGRSPTMRVISEDANTTKASEQVKDDDEDEMLPNPLKAALASALAFLCGSFIPLVSAMFVTDNKTRIAVVVMVTSIALILFGGGGAYLGGSRVRVSAARVLLGGWIAMAITYGLLKPFDDKFNDKVHDAD